MAYWWVNHKQTRHYEVGGDYLWSPVRNADGSRNASYDNMRLASPGDIVFSYANGVIGALGIVMGRASPCPKPTEFGKVGDYWSHDGHFLPVAFRELHQVIKPKAHLAMIAPLLPAGHSPIRPDGNGNQGIYLASISIVLGKLLEDLAGVGSAETALDPVAVPSMEQLEDIHQIEQRSDIPETQRQQLIQARVGQGLFRALVMGRDRCCRMTGVRDHRLLRASHIKPWRNASNSERLDSENGLILSPHIDVLFDQRLVSFENNGDLIVARQLSSEVLTRWRIDPNANIGGLSQRQAGYMEAHRDALRHRGRTLGP
jgi:hypothetical protein